jgi:uncharacterized protein YrrD
MDLYLGVTVEAEDGDGLGYLQGTVHDAGTQEVHSLIVEGSRWDAGAVLMPLEAVQRADGDAVIVSLSSDQFDTLTPYSNFTNLAPPPVADNAAEMEEGIVDIPAVPPIGAAVGVESIGFTPIIDEEPNVSDDELIINRTTLIRAIDADIGHVRAVVVDDETRRLTALVAEQGLLFSDAVTIPMEWAATFNADTVVLSVSADDLHKAQPAD